MISDTALPAGESDGGVQVAPEDAAEAPSHAIPRFDPEQVPKPAAETRREAAADSGLDSAFRTARTPRRWSTEAVPQPLLHSLYDLVKFGPTSANCSPGRFVFLHSRDSRERLRPALSPGNIEPTMAAAVTVIVAQDPLFYENLGRLYPQAEARSWFAADAGLADETAFRNATLQGGYLILAARMLGLDAAPMSGFDNAKVDEIFLAGQGWRSNFLVNLGYADGPPDAPRAPRLAFDEACLLL